MKKALRILLVVTILFYVTGCGKVAEEASTVTGDGKFVSATLNDDGNIVISKDEITSDATFINYQVGGVTIQIIAVLGTDGMVRLAFNTCQSCNPSPNAYFIQKGEYFICQNCGNAFHVDNLGKEKGGCNPLPVSEYEDQEKIIVIEKSYVEEHVDNFAKWAGPTK